MNNKTIIIVIIVSFCALRVSESLELNISLFVDASEEHIAIKYSESVARMINILIYIFINIF
jgi:hypothetical protein